MIPDAIPDAIMVAIALGCSSPGRGSDPLVAAPCPAMAQQPIAPSPIVLRTIPPPFAIPSTPQAPATSFAVDDISAGGVPVRAPAIPPQGPPSPPAPGPQSLDPAPAAATDPNDDIVVTAKKRGSREGDPVAAVNEVAFAATQAVDSAVVRPVAMGYAKVVPRPLRNGLRNFLYNLTEPVVFLNYLLQLKPGKAMETVGRFAINTTVGVGGLFDFARRKPFKLPRRANGFADTLGYYGVRQGAFLFLPIVGPTTVRDLFGNTIDGLLLPVAVGKPFNSRYYTVSTGLGGALDDRVENDEKLAAERKGPNDAYTTNRDAYLKVRQAEIDHLRGRDRKPVADPVERLPQRARVPIP